MSTSPKHLPARPRPHWVRSPRLLAVALLAAFAACHSHEEGAETGATCPSTQTLTYTNFGKGFIQTYCLQCHSTSVQGAARNGAPADHNYDQVADIRSLADHIDMHAGSGPLATNTLMPESGPMPTLDERRKLSEWLACGAP